MLAAQLDVAMLDTPNAALLGQPGAADQDCLPYTEGVHEHVHV